MIPIKVIEIEGDEYIISATNDNYRIIRILLDKEKRKIINKLKIFQTSGLINSIFYPRNKNMQNILDDLVRRKRLITKSTEQINNIFIK